VQAAGNYIYNSTSYGIYIRRTNTRLSIVNNHVYSAIKDGIYSYPGSILTDSLIQDNIFHNNRDGMQLRNVKRCIITGNYIDGGGSRYGISFASNCDNNLVLGNTLTNNSIGIRIVDATSENNQIA